MSEEMESATPAQVEQAEQVQEVESNSTEATAEQTQEQQETQEQKDEAKKEPWFQKRINEQTRKYYEAQREAQALKERLAQYEQRQQYDAPEQEQRQNVDVDALAEQKATKLLAERSFNEACNKVFSEGTKEFSENFEKAVANLQLVGPNRDFLDAVTATDAGHKILNHLGQLENLAEAERIMALPPVKMGLELAKLETKLSQVAVKPVSKAPDPIKPIGGGGAADSGLRDDLPLDEWLRRRNQQRKT